MGGKKKVKIICDMYFSQATGKEGFGGARKINSEYKFWKLKGQPNRIEKTKHYSQLPMNVNIFLRFTQWSVFNTGWSLF